MASRYSKIVYLEFESPLLRGLAMVGACRVAIRKAEDIEALRAVALGMADEMEAVLKKRFEHDVRQLDLDLD